MKAKNLKKKLAARIKSWEDIRTEGSDRGGRTKYIRTDGGKNVAYHKPGANK